MKNKYKVIIVMPAYNAENTLEAIYKKIPKSLSRDIILVDDASEDKTFGKAKKLGIESSRNSNNLGYGGNLKVCFDKALKKGADIVVELHPDGEYEPSAIAPAVDKIIKGADLVLGNRFARSTIPRGMYIWKYIPTRILSFVQAKILRISISDLHQGFRVYSRRLLEKINFENNSNSYLFSFEIIAQASFKSLSIQEVPVTCHYTGKKRGASLGNSITYALGTFKVLFFIVLARLGWRN